MKAILEFTLPEEEQDFKDAIEGTDLRLSIWEFDQWLRSEIKYKDKDYGEVRERLHTILGAHNISDSF